MMHTKKSILIALFIPIIALTGLALYRHYVWASGNTVILPIAGYDPRDLLAGHYLAYKVEYGVGDICGDSFDKEDRYICLDRKTFSNLRPKQCVRFIRGVCRKGQFKAGIEKFYVSEDKAKHLEQQIASQEMHIVLSLMPNGQAQVKDLLLNGESWNKQ